MPFASSLVALYRAAESNRRFRDYLAVFLRRRCVTQGLVFKITAIANQLTQQRNLGIRPDYGVYDGRELPPNRDTRANFERAHGLPPLTGKHSVIGGGPE